ncbi:hypothetical protein ACVWWO_003678 [Bradyrhizobium sp. F1.13.1]
MPDLMHMSRIAAPLASNGRQQQQGDSRMLERFDSMYFDGDWGVGCNEVTP